MAIFAVFLPVLDHSVAEEMSVRNVVTFHFCGYILFHRERGAVSTCYTIHEEVGVGGRRLYEQAAYMNGVKAIHLKRPYLIL